MATLTAIKNRKQAASILANALGYIMQEKKTVFDGVQFVIGLNCVPQSALTEMRTTKQRFHKTDGMQYYHFVQSFDERDGLTPQEANAIGVEFAQREFPGYEVVVATHVDTNHLHNHLVVNSVSCETGRKLHQNAADLQRHRQVNDEICMAHGLHVLEEPQRYSRKKRMKPGEYQAMLRDDSWKFDLIRMLNDALELSITKEDFIANMEYEGYQVTWTDTRKHITFTCPNGRKCRDSSLHDETFLKENLEALFAYREAVGYRPGSVEPDEGWMGNLATGLLRLARQLERKGADYAPQLPAAPVWSDSKQLRREALKKLAMGQKLSHDTNQSNGMTMM